MHVSHLKSKMILQLNNEPEYKHFHVQLLDHILARLKRIPYTWDDVESTDFTDVEIHREQLSIHKTLRIDYVTYDCRHSRDVIKPWLKISHASVETQPNNSSNVMVSSVEDDDENESHAFWYAQVLAIFSV